MRTVIQRVTTASVSIGGEIKGAIEQGLLILLGIEDTDTEADIEWLCRKIAAMRIFADAEGLMNLSVQEVQGGLLVVSQFTLFASTQKGNRPSFIRAARPNVAIPLYEKFVATLRDVSARPVETGEFGADMQVSLINDGPVTILMDSKQRE
jgi:D-aminoacyl-tRNA deacylase